MTDQNTQIRNLRLRSGKSQQKLAEELKCCTRTIVVREKGGVLPEAVICKQWMNSLGCTFEELLGEVEVENYEPLPRGKFKS